MKLIKPLVVLSFLFAFVANTALGFSAASGTLFQQHNKKSSASDLHLKGQNYDLLYFLEEDLSEELDETESTLELDAKEFFNTAFFSFAVLKNISLDQVQFKFFNRHSTRRSKVHLFIVYQVYRI
ncbi:MAG: hypothetical protein RL164_820 [Bacteroidota bacterium]